MKKLTRKERRAAYVATLKPAEQLRIKQRAAVPANMFSMKELRAAFAQKAKLEARVIAKQKADYAKYRETRNNRRVRKARKLYQASRAPESFAVLEAA